MILNISKITTLNFYLNNNSRATVADCHADILICPLNMQNEKDEDYL